MNLYSITAEKLIQPHFMSNVYRKTKEFFVIANSFDDALKKAGISEMDAESIELLASEQDKTLVL